MKQKAYYLLLIYSLLSACSLVDSASDMVISNKFLEVRADLETNSLFIHSNISNTTVVKSILPVGKIASIEKVAVTDTVFNKGTSLQIMLESENTLALTVYQNEPFVFVTPTIKNIGNETKLYNKVKPFSFNIDLGKPANQLKTLGTGGLLEPDKNPGSYVFLTTVDPKTRNGVVTGWISHEKGSGVVLSSIENNHVKINTQIDYGQYRLAAGKSEHLETIVIGYFDDARVGEEKYADVMAKYLNITLSERSAVYCSWYSEKNGGAGDEASTIELADYIGKNMKQYGMGVVQIDDQWQGGGSYNGPTRGFNRTRKEPLKGAVINGTSDNGFPAGYPNGMEKTTNAIKNAGLTAGIWWMPFARNHQDEEYKNRQDWFAYRLNGQPYETAWGGTSLDLTNPKAINQVAEFSKLLHSWGFDYFKMDGLWTGTITEQVYINDGYLNDSIGNMKPLYNPKITQIEAFRNGLKTIRTATNNEVFLSGCNLSQNMRSFGPSIGLVDAMRIGPDFNHDGENFRTGAIRASRLYFLNGRVWWNDPDPSMIREKGASSADPAAAGIGSLERARILPSFVALSSQFFLSSDWIPDLPEERKEIMRRTMVSHDGIARPVDAFDRNLPSVWRVSSNNEGTDRNVIGLFNWENKQTLISCDLNWAGMDGTKSYFAFDFWANKPLQDVNKEIQQSLPKESCQVIALREKCGHPVVVSTSQHVTQGMIDLIEEKWESNTLSGKSTIIAGDTYEIRIAGLNDGRNWEIKEARITGNDTSIRVLPQENDGWLRVIIDSKETTEVSWQLKF